MPNTWACETSSGKKVSTRFSRCSARRIPVAEVVRDLWRRDQERGLSAGEKRMLAKARQILVGELALAENTDDEKAAIILDEALAAAS